MTPCLCGRPFGVSTEMLNYRDAVLYEKDAKLFRAPAWLNDACLNFGFRLLEKDDVYLMDPAVYSYMMLQMEDEDELHLPVSTCRMILVPISDASDLGTTFRGSHWSLLAYYPSENLFEHYDSMRTSGHQRRAAPLAAQKLTRLLGGDLSMSIVETPQQTNGYDCGAFVLYFAKLLVDNAHIDEDRAKMLNRLATPENVAAFRAELAEGAWKMMRH